MGSIATVSVSLVVTVDVPSGWGGDSTIAEIRRMGVESAVGVLHRLIEKNTGIKIKRCEAVEMLVREG